MSIESKNFYDPTFGQTILHVEDHGEQPLCAIGCGLSDFAQCLKSTTNDDESGIIDTSEVAHEGKDLNFMVEILEKMQPNEAAGILRYLHWKGVREIISSMQNPETLAIIFAHMNPSMEAEILLFMPHLANLVLCHTPSEKIAKIRQIAGKYGEKIDFDSFLTREAVASSEEANGREHGKNEERQEGRRNGEEDFNFAVNILENMDLNCAVEILRWTTKKNAMEIIQCMSNNAFAAKILLAMENLIDGEMICWICLEKTKDILLHVESFAKRAEILLSMNDSFAAANILILMDYLHVTCTLEHMHPNKAMEILMCFNQDTALIILGGMDPQFTTQILECTTAKQREKISMLMRSIATASAVRDQDYSSSDCTPTCAFQAIAQQNISWENVVQELCNSENWEAITQILWLMPPEKAANILLEINCFEVMDTVALGMKDDIATVKILLSMGFAWTAAYLTRRRSEEAVTILKHMNAFAVTEVLTSMDFLKFVNILQCMDPKDAQAILWRAVPMKTVAMALMAMDNCKFAAAICLQGRSFNISLALCLMPVEKVNEILALMPKEAREEMKVELARWPAAEDNLDAPQG
ncbi:MAG: hypothetical protein LBI69_04795 [Puniceicoccales bacterium]|jgi:flagellar motility protein MotE (MotC chaperone)|nr:hypothetical protein [Puniceicoccales bacterium]